jgi:hypothetical protein
VFGCNLLAEAIFSVNFNNNKMKLYILILFATRIASKPLPNNDDIPSNIHVDTTVTTTNYPNNYRNNLHHVVLLKCPHIIPDVSCLFTYLFIISSFSSISPHFTCNLARIWFTCMSYPLQMVGNNCPSVIAHQRVRLLLIQVFYYLFIYSYFVAILDGADYNDKQFGLAFAAKYVLMNICSDDAVNDKGIKADVSYLKICRAQTLFVRVNGQTIG